MTKLEEEKRAEWKRAETAELWRNIWFVALFISWVVFIAARLMGH